MGEQIDYGCFRALFVGRDLARVSGVESEPALRGKYKRTRAALA